MRQPHARITHLFFFVVVPLMHIFCINDQGILSPDDDRNQIPLAQFRGSAIMDTAWGPEFINKLNTLKNPRVELSWQYFGYTRYTTSHDIGNIPAQWPYLFSGTLLQPLPREVYEYDEPAIGTFWLYGDCNGNGRFDRRLHPELAKRDPVISSLKQRYYQELSALLPLGSLAAVRTEEIDTFLVGPNGSLLRPSGDTIIPYYYGDPGNTEAWRGIIGCWLEIIQQPNKWEYFFYARKRATTSWMVIDTLESLTFRVRQFSARALFPVPGKELEFEIALRNATLLLALVRFEMLSAYEDAVANGWLNYPFEGKNGEDFIVGGSRWYHVLYFPNQAGVDEIKKAETASSFIVEGKDRIHTGFNLLKCDDQYRCKVCSWEDTIFVSMGNNWEFFDPPSGPAEKPVVSFTEQKPVAITVLNRYEGAYSLRSMKYLVIVSKPPYLWAVIDDRGSFRLTPYNSTRFYSPFDTSIQLEALVEADGAVSKLLFYKGRNRYIPMPENDPALFENTRAAIDTLCAKKRVTITASRLDSLASNYDWNGALMQVSALSESLAVAIPGLMPQPFYPASSSIFFSDRSDMELHFIANEQGDITGVTVSGTGIMKRTAPRLDYIPRSAAVIANSAAVGFTVLLSQHQGTGHDTWRSLDGKPRYLCSQYSGDSLFLRPGDGCVLGLSPARPSDSISLHDGGDRIIFRLPDRDTASFMSLEATVVSDSASSGKRVRLAVEGGTNPDSLTDLVCDDFWITLSSNGTVVVIDPIKTPAGGYYVALEIAATMNQERYCAFDSYRIGGQ